MLIDALGGFVGVKIDRYNMGCAITEEAVDLIVDAATAYGVLQAAHALSTAATSEWDSRRDRSGRFACANTFYHLASQEYLDKVNDEQVEFRTVKPHSKGDGTMDWQSIQSRRGDPLHCYTRRNVCVCAACRVPPGPHATAPGGTWLHVPRCDHNDRVED